LRASLAPNAILTVETAPTSAPSSWTVVDTYGGPSGFSTFGNYQDHAPAVAGDGQPFRFQFHLVVTGPQTTDGVYLDNVGVKCGSSFILGPNTFGSSLSGYTHGGTHDSWGTASIAYTWVYMSGTSMATPMVVGAAALLWAAHPNEAAAGIRDALLRSVDPDAALAGKTVTGG